LNTHILHIAPTPFFSDRGCHIRIEGIVRCLQKLGYDNTVCTYHHGRDVEGVNTVRISTIINYTQTAAGPSKYKLLADWKLLWLAFKQYKRIKPIAIHAHLHEGIVVGIVLKCFFFWRRTPLIADMQGSLTGELESHGAFKRLPVLRWLSHLLERILMWCSNYILCSSRHSLDKIQSEFSIKLEKISLAQDGANPQTVLSKDATEQLKSELGLPLDKTIAVYSGALLNAKGLGELKQLIKQTNAQTNAVHFLIIGYPIENLRDYLQQHELYECCCITGQIEFEKLPRYLALADIAIDPKNSDAGEGSGKMLNYLACSLPVVAFDGDNNREFLPSSTILAHTVSELVEQLIQLHSDPALKRQTALNNLSHFEQNYSWQVTQKQLKSVYSKLVD
jgi:glycosyltransferase involved in cell wall biosynthesis